MENMAEQSEMEPFGEDVTDVCIEEEQTCYEDVFIGPDCGEEGVTALMGQEWGDTSVNGGKKVESVTMDISGIAEKVPAGTSVAGEIEDKLPCGDWPVCNDTEPLDRPGNGDREASDGFVYIKQESASEDADGKGGATGEDYDNDQLGEVPKPADTAGTGRPTPKHRAVAGRCNGDLRIPGGIRIEGQVVTVSKAYLYSLSKRAKACSPKRRFVPALLDHLSRNGLRATVDHHTDTYLSRVAQYFHMRDRTSSFYGHRLTMKYCRFPCVWEKVDSTATGDIRAAVEQLGQQLAAEASQVLLTDESVGRLHPTGVRRSQREPRPRQLWTPPPRLLRRRKNQPQQAPLQQPRNDPNSPFGLITPGQPDSSVCHAEQPGTITVSAPVDTVATAAPVDTSDSRLQQGNGANCIAPMAPDAHPLTVKMEPPDDPAVDVPAPVDESFYRSIKEEQEEVAENAAVTDVDVFSCSFCNDHVSLRRAELTLHVKCRHPGAIRKGLYNIMEGEPAESAQRLFCDVCDAAFGSESTLIVHSWSHLAEIKAKK